MKSPLRVVAENSAGETLPADPTNGLYERVRQLQADARRLAREHVEILEARLRQTRDVAAQIADGGEAYPPGVRELARRLAEDSGARALCVEAIMERF